MILRAIFWIGLVALLMPREPNGLGRPATPGAQLASGLSSALKQQSCGGEEAACSATVRILERVKLSGARSLAGVKAEIEQAERAREARGS